MAPRDWPVMKVAHFADIHYCQKHLEEVDRCFTAAVDQLIADDDIDFVVIAGDSTDHQMAVHDPAFLALAKQVSRLASKWPVLMLQGTFSHEPIGVLRLLGLLSSNIFVGERVETVCWSKGRGWATVDVDSLLDGCDFVVSCLPSLNKALHYGSGEGQYQAKLVSDLTGFARVNSLAREKGVPSMLVSHGTVSGAVTEQGMTLNGTDHEYAASDLLAANASAVMLGHIHQYQRWATADGKRVVAYSNAVGRLHFGDHGDKGFLLWDVLADSAVESVVKTPARNMVTWKFAGAPDKAEFERLLQIAADTCIRVDYAIDEEHVSTVDQKAIESALLSAGAKLVKFERKIVRLERDKRSEVVSGQSVDALLASSMAAHQTPDSVRPRLLEKLLQLV
jgi:DNA repair protein SbcD/Mre11